MLYIKNYMHTNYYIKIFHWKYVRKTNARKNNKKPSHQENFMIGVDINDQDLNDKDGDVYDE